MIEKLLAEAQADATEKAFCDKEMAETEAKKAEMDKLRAEENAAFVTNSAEMKQGVDGIQKALKVLNEYYAKDAAHASADGAGSGIIGLLEVCESDFTKGLAEMTAAENTAVNEYDVTSKENDIAKATKGQDVKYKTKEAKGLDKDTSDANNDKSGEQTELDAVNQYYKGIQGRCIAKPESYADRVARRTAEIAGLKEALTILDGEAVLLQRSTKHALRGHLQIKSRGVVDPCDGISCA